MKKLSLISIVALSACSIFGPSYSGETTASPLLKLDTERNINLYFQAIHKCTPDKIHTKSSIFQVKVMQKNFGLQQVVIKRNLLLLHIETMG